MMSRRHPTHLGGYCGDGTIIGQPAQGGQAPAFSVPREHFTQPPPPEKSNVSWRRGERQQQHHWRRNRSDSSPPQGSWVPQTRQPFVLRSYRADRGGGDPAFRADSSFVTYGHNVAAPSPLTGHHLITPSGGGSAPTRHGSVLPDGRYSTPDGCFSSPEGVFTAAGGEDLLRFQGGLAAWPRGEGGLVAVTGGEGGKEVEEDGELHGREVGYKVAGRYVARAAASPNALPLPPLYHLLEVAHREQRRELEERFAAKEAKMKEEQESLRSQLRLLEATNANAGNTHQAQPDQLKIPRNTTGREDVDTQKADNYGGEGTVTGDTVTTNDTPDSSAASEADNDSANTGHVSIKNDVNSRIINDTGSINLKNDNNGDGGGSSSSSSSMAPLTSAADRIKAAREAVSVSLQELIASGEKLGRMRKEADQARRRVRSMISPTSDGRGAAASMAARRSTVGFLQASSSGWLKLSTDAKMRILSEIERELSVPQQDLSKRVPTPPRPTTDEQICFEDGGGGVDGAGGDVAATAGGGKVEPLLLLECSVSPALAARTARNEEGDLKTELEAVKERLRLAEEQLSEFKTLETNAASRAAEAEGEADRLRVQLEARKQQIDELREISQGNLVRAQRRREAVGVGGEEPGV